MDCSFHPAVSFPWGWALFWWIWFNISSKENHPSPKRDEVLVPPPQIEDNWEQWIIWDDEDKRILDTQSWNSPKPNDIGSCDCRNECHTVLNNSFWNLNFMSTLLKTEHKNKYFWNAIQEKKAEPIPPCYHPNSHIKYRDKICFFFNLQLR